MLLIKLKLGEVKHPISTFVVQVQIQDGQCFAAASWGDWTGNVGECPGASHTLGTACVTDSGNEPCRTGLPSDVCDVTFINISCAPVICMVRA